MNRLPILLFILLFTGQATAGDETPEKVYQWLVRQQGDGALLGNQEGDDYSGMYSNALAAICFIHRGDTERAERIFKVFQGYYADSFKDPPGGFPQFWDARHGSPHGNSDRWIGDNAWLLIALNRYREKTGRTDFDEMRAGIARWLISLQDKDGGVWSGFNALAAPIESKSTEGNLDSYAALVDFPREQSKIERFLRLVLWQPRTKSFKMGTTSGDPALDCSAWAVAVLGLRYKETLQFAEKTFGRTKVSKATGQPVTGFMDLLFKDRVWLEGTGEMAVAYRAAGNARKAREYVAELEKAVAPSEKFEGTAGIACHTNNPPWPGGDEKIFVPSQCWYLFGAWGVNPMQPWK